MCHNSGVQDAQIDKFVEQGMPQKIIKTVKYTIKKRAEEHNKSPSKETCNCANKSKTTAEMKLAMTLMSNKRPHVEPQKIPTCPFGRGLGLIKENIEDITDIIDGNQPQQQRRPPQATSNEIYSDVLAISTQWTRQLVVCFRGTVTDLRSSRIYTLLTKTTQPAHVIAVCILSLILLTFWPEIIDSTSGSEETSKAKESRHNQAVVIAYLGAFATHFGAQIWMTFVSGLSLYFALPRHTFGQCQKILFPKYFTLNSLLSIFMLILFVKFFLANWNFSYCVQVSVLALAAVVEVTVRLYLVPPMLLLMQEKYKIEDAVGSGQEVGGLVQGDLVKCPHYQRIHKLFRRIHMTVAIGNIVTLLCTCVHMYYLASKISFT